MGWRFEGSTYSFRVAEGVERVGGLSGRRGGGVLRFDWSTYSILGLEGRG